MSDRCSRQARLQPAGYRKCRNEGPNQYHIGKLMYACELLPLHSTTGDFQFWQFFNFLSNGTRASEGVPSLCSHIGKSKISRTQWGHDVRPQVIDQLRNWCMTM